MPEKTPGPRCLSAPPSACCSAPSWFPREAGGAARRKRAHSVRGTSWHPPHASAKPLQVKAKQMPDTPTTSVPDSEPLEQLMDMRAREISGLATYLQWLAEKEKAEI